MSMAVLQDRTQIRRAREQLERRGLSCLESRGRRLARRLLRHRRPSIGDEVKSWDVLATVEFIETHVSRTAQILDLGAYASEILPVLLRLGYTSLAGVDLNPRLPSSPDADRIRYEIADFMHTPFADEQFAAVTAISVIEHGFNAERLLAELARLLQPGGFFIASFDYWPQKIDTGGQRFFDLDWLIFSADDVRRFLAQAETYALRPFGQMSFEAREKPIHCAGQDYTFGWLVLQKAR
jgi:SAM-dependent methyltransferase